MAELSPAPPVRIEAASGQEKGGARDRQALSVHRVSKPAPASAPPSAPDIDLDEKEEKHQLDERA